MIASVTDTQLYLAVGLPVFAVLINILMGVLQYNGLNARFASVDARFTSLEARFETLIGKVIEIDNRLTRVEAILERH